MCKKNDFSKFVNEVTNQMKRSDDFNKSLNDDEITTKEEF